MARVVDAEILHERERRPPEHALDAPLERALARADRLRRAREREAGEMRARPDLEPLDESVFYIVDAFGSDEDRGKHLSGDIAKALMAKAGELLAEPPKIEKADVLASKVKG
jgi:quinol monooxygenase YgiN